MGDAPGRQEAVDRSAVGLLDFNLRAVCPKCRGDRFSWRYTISNTHAGGWLRCPEVMGDAMGHLDLSCDRCGYTIGMKTADA